MNYCYGQMLLPRMPSVASQVPILCTLDVGALILRLAKDPLQHLNAPSV